MHADRSADRSADFPAFRIQIERCIFRARQNPGVPTTTAERARAFAKFRSLRSSAHCSDVRHSRTLIYTTRQGVELLLTQPKFVASIESVTQTREHGRVALNRMNRLNRSRLDRSSTVRLSFRHSSLSLSLSISLLLPSAGVREHACARPANAVAVQLSVATELARVFCRPRKRKENLTDLCARGGSAAAAAVYTFAGCGVTGACAAAQFRDSDRSVVSQRSSTDRGGSKCLLSYFPSSSFPESPGALREVSAVSDHACTGSRTDRLRYWRRDELLLPVSIPHIVMHYPAVETSNRMQTANSYTY